jgi:tetratricopeptide (TPR) repeat protein
MQILCPIIVVLLLHAAGGSATVAVGDEAFHRIDYPSAIQSYEEQLPAFPNDSELLWRLARVYVCAGEVKESSEGIVLFIRAERYARHCIQFDSSSAEGHTWLAAALGYRALSAGMKEQVHLTNEMHNEIEKAITLDPNNDVAYSMRGSLFRALGNVGWFKRSLASVFVGSLPDGDFEKAEEALTKALALAPDVMRHQYELGVLYLDWGRDAEAKRALRGAMRLPIRVAIDVQRVEKIKKLLAEL